jgi:RsmE family RNA methyltransferase
MQLFIVSPDEVVVRDDCLVLTNDRVCGQLTRVLRAKSWYACVIQTIQESAVVRREIIVETITAWSLQARIWSIYHKRLTDITSVAFLIALPNKWDKLELILQKLTEVGVSEIILCPTERSQLTSIPQQKRQRRQIILLEAAEQAWRRDLPRIRFIKKLWDLEITYSVTVFDLPMRETSSNESLIHADAHMLNWDSDHVICGVVGPEWWLTVWDYAALPWPYCIVWLGDSVLRTETAAIIGAWKLVNNQ